MSDNESQLGLYKVLGELGADMKHVLRALEKGRASQQELRGEMRKDTEELKKRLTKVETFNVKVLTLAGVATPVILVAVNQAVPWLASLLP